ncbi:hypothetical protein DM02DRAFT_660874 [Periconia macrospinosa]|uniref:MHYT domain-containing protein n=1 Tax=Periconia macrospinosa TaxID=97972 RepID=A0A2V1DBV5_9PLEO|nr:hypothetical protein DM02DRAFT_660874 [Periconia macrospinosa]
METSVQDKYPVGSRPHIHYIPYVIFLSYIVSFIGAFTTVELLHRRQSGTSWRSWVQLFACSVSFALVAIWCMHFVGNRSIVLGDGEEEIQLYYSPTFTAASAILPIVVVFLGLAAADRFYKGNRRAITRYAALLMCGICAGAAVTEMHYLGNNGTRNYRIILRVEFVIGASFIAVGACLIAFSLFFHWSGHWMNNLWRRLFVACFLALAVSGMHYTAAAGTAYELTGYHSGFGQARNINLIIAVCMCLSACMVCFCMGFLKQVHKRKLRDRAEQVVLAVAMFDEDGKLLVTPAGVLPCQTITRQFFQRTFDDDFNLRHPVFQWLYQVSRNWGGIVDLIPAMREHLGHTGYFQPRTAPIQDPINTEDDTDTSYSATFREMFCVAAQDIARSMGTRLQNLGQLYENVETTGTLHTARNLFLNNNSKPILALDVTNEQADPEAGHSNPITFGRGQLLVLTRKVSGEEASRFQDRGFRFASIDQVNDQLAQSLQISRDDLQSLIGRLHSSCERASPIPRKGTYLASFLLKPSPAMKGLDIIVPRTNPGCLPMVKLVDEELTLRELRMLSSFDGCTANDCLNKIGQHTGKSPEESVFLVKFRNKIRDLFRVCPDDALEHAVFSAQQLDMAHGANTPNDLSQATVFAFCGIKEVYNQSLQNSHLRAIPLSFFRTSLRACPGSPDHAILAQQNHKEFSTLLSSTIETSGPSSPRKIQVWNMFCHNSSARSSSLASISMDNISEKGLVDATSLEGFGAPGHPFGGIMVSQNIVVSDAKEDAAIELKDLGIRSVAGIADGAQPTLADKLLAITASIREIPPHSPGSDSQNRW